MFNLLDKRHDRIAFDCGNDEINRYLQTMANQHAKKGITRTHVLTDGARIKAFYTLTATAFDNSQKHISGYPNEVPAIIIGRIGVDNHYQGQGLSKIAIAHALQTIKQASHEIGVAFVMIDAKNDELANYYERLGFVKITDNRLVFPTSRI